MNGVLFLVSVDIELTLHWCISLKNAEGQLYSEMPRSVAALVFRLCMVIYRGNSYC